MTDQMKAMSPLSCLLFVVLCPLVISRRLEQASPEPEAQTSRVGFWEGDVFPLLSRADNGSWVGFEALLRDELAQRAGLNIEAVGLPTLPERITSLQNGTVDWVLAVFSVTPERQKLVQFVKPYYLSAGAALFAPGGQIPGVSKWEDLNGKGLAVRDGYYANDELAKYGAKLVKVETAQDAVGAINRGEAVAFVDDSTSLRQPGNLTIVSALPPILPTPYGIAVKLGNNALADRLSKALMEMVSGGQSAPILRIEKETFGAAGAPPNADLQALVANPSGISLLNPGA